MTCDPADDTIDLFSSLQAGVAVQAATINYKQEEEWKKFFESLLYIIDYENRLYQRLTFDQKWDLEKSMLDCCNKIEQ